jgi:hypothetical protein
VQRERGRRDRAGDVELEADVVELAVPGERRGIDRDHAGRGVGADGKRVEDRRAQLGLVGRELGPAGVARRHPEADGPAGVVQVHDPLAVEAAPVELEGELALPDAVRARGHGQGEKQPDSQQGAAHRGRVPCGRRRRKDIAEDS